MFLLNNMENKGRDNSNRYDKVIKENLEAIFLPLAEKFLGIHINRTEKLTGKLQITLEREPDFIRIVETKEGNRFILHLEFQTNNESGMVYRMAEYKAIIQRKYQIPVQQFVVYLGMKPPDMRILLTAEEQILGFKLIDISAIHFRELLAFDIPEAIILAVLANFRKEQSSSVLRLILLEIKRLSKNESELKKYLEQLKILSRLRKLEEETLKFIEAMPITYDITNDFLYLKGKKEVAKNLLLSDLFTENAIGYKEIAQMTNLPLAEIKRIHREMKN